MAGADRERSVDRLGEPVERHGDVLGELRRRAPRSTACDTPSRQRHSSSDRGGVRRRVNASRPRQRLDELVAHAPRLAPSRRPREDREAAPSARRAGTPAADAQRARRVEVLDHRRRDPLPSTRSIASQPAAVSGTSRATGSCGLRRRHEPQPGRGDDPERPLRADQQRAQVVAGDVLAHRAADAHQLARREHRLEPGDPVAGHAVLKACGPPALVAIVAAELRLLGGARVGREEQPVLAGAAARPSRVVTPASASIRHSSGSKRAPRVRRSSAIATASPSGPAAPPAKPLRPPTGDIATSCA